MSVPDPAPPRKVRYVGLVLPFALLLVGVAVWSGLWIWGRAQAQARMDQAVAALSRAGYQIGWKERRLGGYPFRLDVTLTDAVVREPSGWALEAPRLEAEAYLYASGRWVMAAPQGLTLVRPVGGPVRVTGRIIRASLGDLEARPPSLDVQGLDVRFEPAPGAQPFGLDAAGKVELHLRPGPDDQGGVFLSVDKGRARLTGLLGRIAGDKPVSLEWNASLSKMSAFSGEGWAQAVRAWADAGGTMTVRPSSRLIAGDALLAVRSGELTAGRDGRLRGSLAVALRQAPRALGAMAETGLVPAPSAEAAGAVAAARQEGDTAQAAIGFEAGQTTLGPVALGPAPKVYTAN
jgi:hypothetical protein